MRAITVYQLKYRSNATDRIRHPIGSVLELRKQERVGNYNDLLRMARRLFASDTVDASDITIDANPFRQSYHPESTRGFTANSPEDTTSFRMLGAGSRK